MLYIKIQVTYSDTNNKTTIELKHFNEQIKTKNY